MSYYGFEYFCGANVMVRIEDFPVLEVAGIAYELTESIRPIYGYSSRLFDAVARGQVLVQGYVAVNFVHEDYLFEAVKLGLGRQNNVMGTNFDALNDVHSPLENAGMVSGADFLLPDGTIDTKAVEAAKGLWTETEIAKLTQLNATGNPSDITGGLNIKIIFGQQDALHVHGDTGLLLAGVYFSGRGQTIQVSEDVIIERYPFIARNIHSLRRVGAKEYVQLSSGEMVPLEEAQVTDVVDAETPIQMIGEEPTSTVDPFDPRNVGLTVPTSSNNIVQFPAISFP